MKYCLIIPHYNHERQFVDFLPKLLATGLTCIVVDDGSCESSFAAINEAVQGVENVYLFSHKFNRGKGAAVKTGICHARHLGYSHAIQIDSDGQHAVEDIEKFIGLSQECPQAIVCGRPTFDDTVPKVRLYGRKITDFWVILETFSFDIQDGLCGFRIYPVEAFEKIVDRYYIGTRMDFDTDIVVKAMWMGVGLKFIDTAVQYPEMGVSHFQYLRDNFLLVRLHSRLMLGMAIRVPLLIYRAIERRKQST